MYCLISPWIFSPRLTLKSLWLHFSICLKALELDPRSADHQDSLWINPTLVPKARTRAWHPRPFIIWPLLISHSPSPVSSLLSPFTPPTLTSSFQAQQHPTSWRPPLAISLTPTGGGTQSGNPQPSNNAEKRSSCGRTPPSSDGAMLCRCNFIEG